jgi:hypothetical protein
MTLSAPLDQRFSPVPNHMEIWKSTLKKGMADNHLAHFLFLFG